MAIAPDKLEFRGADATEAQDFVHAVRRHAFSQEKSRDYLWTADYAASCFIRGALVWFNRLDETVQTDWPKLQDAILRRFWVTFSGIGGEEAEAFVHSIRTMASDSGKLHDNDWIVDLVATSLVGDALRWHVDLDPEIKGDWEPLQRAIFARWPRPTDRPAGSTVCTPPAAVPQSKITKGRIKIIDVEGGTSSIRYVSRTFTSGYAPTSKDVSDALTVECDLSVSSAQALSIAGQIATYDFFGITWYKADPTDSDNFATLGGIGGAPGATTKSQTSYSGPTSSKVWRIDSAKGLEVVSADGGTVALVSRVNKGNDPSAIWLAGTNCTRSTSHALIVKLMFEPV